MERWGGRRNNGQSCEKAKAKLTAKMENRKMCWGARQRIDRQLSNYNLRRLLCPKSGRQREAPPILVAFTKEFFLSWPEWFSFFLLWTCFPFVSFFFYQNLSSAFSFSTRKQLFHEQRASTSEFCKVRKVKKIGKKKRAPLRAVAAKIPPGDRPWSEIMTPSWFINFSLKIRFSKLLRCF